MKPFPALYLRSIRAIGPKYLFVLVGYLVMSALILWILPFPEAPQNGLTYLINFLFFASLPFLLSSSFQEDVLAKTDAQWFSFPVKRSTVVLSRFVAIFTFLCVSALAGFLWSLLTVPVQITDMESAVKRAGSTDFDKLIPYRHDFWGFVFNMSRDFLIVQLFAVCSFVLMSAVLFTQSLRYAFRMNGFFRSALLLALFVLFCWLGLRGGDFRYGFLGLQPILKSVFAGIGLLATGLFLFDRYAEV